MQTTAGDGKWAGVSLTEGNRGLTRSLSASTFGWHFGSNAFCPWCISCGENVLQVVFLRDREAGVALVEMLPAKV